jgi:hypothetical protein
MLADNFAGLRNVIGLILIMAMLISVLLAVNAKVFN